MSSPKFAFNIFSTWIFFNVFLFASSVERNTHYVEDFCYGWQNTKTFFLKNGYSGTLTSILSKSDSGECTINLEPQFGFSVVLSIYRFHLSSEDKLTITDSDKFQVALIGEGDFVDERKSFISDGKMVIHYSWNRTQDYGSSFKFQFVFTQARTHGPCKYDEFQCKNLYCIAKDLVCDRHNHCGDNSDEKNCGPKTEYPRTNYPEQITVKKPSVWLITIIACSVVLAVVIIVFIVLAVRSNSRRKKKLASKDLQPTTTSNNSPLTVAATIPQNPTAPPATEAPPSLFTRFRQSLRGTKPSATAPPEEPKTDVPSMYPQIPSTPDLGGVENPDFKRDEV